MQSKRRLSDSTETIGFAILQFLVLFFIVAFTLRVASRIHAQDLRTYYDYSLKVFQGNWPYRDFNLEYPPLALLPFVLPQLVNLGRSLNYINYVWLFAIQNVLLSALVAVILVRIVSLWQPRRHPVPVLKVFSLLMVVSAPLLPWRYDLFPALLTLLSLLAVLADRPTTAGLWLGLGIAAKLYPVVVLPIYVIYYFSSKDYGSLNRLLLGCVGVTGLVLMPFILVDSSGLISFLRFHQMRGLQIESLPAGIISLARLLGLTDASAVLDYSAWHITGPLAQVALKAHIFVLGLGFLVVYAGCWGRFRDEYATSETITDMSLVAYVVAALLTFVATNKVFSPQFIIWLVPLAPLLPLRQARTLLVICLFTIIIFPFSYNDLIAMRFVPVAFLNVRNALLVGLLIWLLIEHLPASMRTDFAWRYRTQ
jgi:hypothetical protein